MNFSSGRFTTNDTSAVVVTIILTTIVLVCNIAITTGQQFVYLAQAFLDGHTWVVPVARQMNDFSFFQGRWYWPLGPFPSILLLPGVFLGQLFGFKFLQGHLQFVLVLGIIACIYRIARHYDFSFGDSLWLAFAFIGASTFLDIGLIPFGWYFAHVVTVFFLFLALHEYFYRQRWLVIGLCLAAAAMTRTTAAIGVIFFLFHIASLPLPWRERRTQALKLLLPLGGAVVLIGLYNLVRFDSVFEPGYRYQVLVQSLTTARSYGMFSLTHLPGNLYYFFLGHPLPVLRDGISHVLKPPYLLPDPWGMSIFIMSPYYILLFFSSPNTPRERWLWATVMAMAVPVFLYYGIGYIQVGYRYALDFLPFLFLLLLQHLRRTSDHLSLRLRFLFVSGFLVNFFFTLILRTPR